MRILVSLALASVAAVPAVAGELGSELSTVTLQNVGRSVEKLTTLENAVKEEAGLLPLRLEKPRMLADIVAEECPGATDAYVESFPADVARLNPDLFKDPDSVTMNTYVGSRSYDITTVYIPYCLGALSEKYIVKEGDSLWHIFQNIQQATGFDNWEQFLAEAARLNGADIEKKALTEGDVISLPTKSWRIPLTTDKAKILVDRLNAVDRLDGQVIMEVNPTQWGNPNSRLNAADEESCTTMDELDALQGAENRLREVADALMLNDELDEEYAYRRNKAVTRVAILDTGADVPGHPTMRRLIFPLTKRSEMFAFPEDPLSYHGTGVLFTAAGGYFLSTLNPLGVAVEAAPYNVDGSVCPQRQNCVYGADPSRLRTAMDAAFERRSNVSAVNISISFTGEKLEPWFKNSYLGTDKDVLVVVSAGNDGLPIGDDNKISPAIYGGDESSNLITVAGIDLDRNLLPSSNHSAEKVDIAAWGCNVPVAEYDRSKRVFVRKLRSGTSYAAPHVLFAAAMILRERPRTRSQLSPSEVKIRLVTSADHNLGLWSKVRHGRVLNFAKALSLHSDVVELKDTGALLHGKVGLGSGDQGIAQICGDQSPLRSSLLSIHDLGQAPSPGTQPILIYTRSSSVGGGVETSWCNAITSDVILTDPFTNEETHIAANDIASIVFATYENEGN